MSDPERVTEATAGDSSGTEEDPGWPIGFMLFVGLAALYLVWRFVQLGVRLVGWLF